MSDNIVSFPGSDAKEESNKFTADDALNKCLGRYEDVIVIGLGKGKAQCVSSIPLDETIYELSRAIHILHRYIDSLE